MPQLPPLSPPYGLIREQLNQGHVIPFLGAGASLAERTAVSAHLSEGDAPATPLAVKVASGADATDRTGETSSATDWESTCLPTAMELARYLARKTAFPPDEQLDLAKVAQYYGVVGGRDPLHRDLHRIFNKEYPIATLHSFLADVPTPLLIITTNYDDLIECAFKAQGRAFDVVIHTTNQEMGDLLLWWPHGATRPEKVNPNKLDIDLKSVTVIYKMHGAVDRAEPSRDQYVITEDDYIDFLARMIKRKAIPAIFAEPFQTRHFLFLGYSLADWNLRVVLNRIEKDLRRPKSIKSWAIRYQARPMEQRFWQERGVEMYDMTIAEFLQQLKAG